MKKRALYDHHRKHVGHVTLHKKNQKAVAVFSEASYLADVVMDIDKWEEYRRGFGFQYEEELGQIRMEDLL